MRPALFLAILFLLGCDNSSALEEIKSDAFSGVLLGAFLDKGVTEEDLRSAGVIGELTDNEGNTYSWVRIAQQVWMSENLRSSQYCDGSFVMEGEIHDNKIPNMSDVGKLYSISAAANTDLSSANPSYVQGVCPCGWHLPSKSEFQQMLKVINLNALPLHDDFVSNRLRTFDKKNGGFWCDGSDDYAGNNYSGFSALPAGIGVKFGSIFDLENTFSNTFFWTSEPSYFSEMKKNDVYTVFVVGKGINYASPLLEFLPVTTHYRASVRCVRNL